MTQTYSAHVSSWCQGLPHQFCGEYHEFLHGLEDKAIKFTNYMLLNEYNHN